MQAIEHMHRAVETELRGALAYFGEDVDTPEGPKPEDLFSIIVSFSSSLRKAALEMHDAKLKAETAAAAAAVLADKDKGKDKDRTPTSSRIVSNPRFAAAPAKQTFATKKPASSVAPVAPSYSRTYLIPPPPPIPTEVSAGDVRHRSIGRGELDETIKSMRRGVRRDRDRERAAAAAARPLSKMFLDGS